MNAIKKRGKLYLFIMMISLFLTGCVSRNQDSFSYRIFAAPLNQVIDFLAQSFNGNYGLAIIIIVFVIRALLFPLSLRQQEAAIRQTTKMKVYQPHLNNFQERLKNASNDQERMAIQQEQMAFMKENNVSLFGGMGCLPLLIQLPIISGLYMAVFTNEALKQGSFLGLPLSQPNFWLALAIVGLYALQGYLSLLSFPEEQRKQQQFMIFIMPLSIAFIVFSSPLSLSLYFFVSAIAGILQMLYTTFVYRPRIISQVEAEMEANPIQVKASPRQDVTNTVKEDKPKKIKTTTSPKNPPKDKRRNAGKQRRRK